MQYQLQVHEHRFFFGPQLPVHRVGRRRALQCAVVSSGRSVGMGGGSYSSQVHGTQKMFQLRHLRRGRGTLHQSGHWETREIFLSLLNVVRVDEAHGVDLVFRVPAVDSRDTAAGSSRNCPRARRDSQPRLPALPTSAYLSGTHTTFVANDAAGSSPRGRWTHVPVPTGDAPYQLPQHPGGCASPPVWRSLVCSQLCTLPQFSQVSIWWRRHHTCGILNAASNFATQFPPQREAPGSDDVKLFEIILSRGKGQGDVTQYKIYFVVVSYMGSTTTVKTSAEICKSLMTWLIVEFSCLVVDHCNWTSGGRPVGGASRHGS
ncbi:hypothetical protein TNCV_117301 [Trichonephila clavipes]|nr:hypothetical protein TNCV_117301 [Trichonephila clavipes]